MVRFKVKICRDVTHLRVGPSKLDDVCETYNLKPLGSFPIDSNLATLIDKGEAEKMNVDHALNLTKDIIEF